jgi:hypothetical protein
MSSTIGIRTRTLRRVAATLFFGLIASTAMAQKPEGSATPLEGTYWRVTELAGRPTPTQDAKREAGFTSSNRSRRRLEQSRRDEFS